MCTLQTRITYERKHEVFIFSNVYHLTLPFSFNYFSQIFHNFSFSLQLSRIPLCICTTNNETAEKKVNKETPFKRDSKILLYLLINIQKDNDLHLKNYKMLSMGQHNNSSLEELILLKCLYCLN